MAENKLQKINVGDQVIARVENLTKVGFTCPRDYNFINAIKASMLVLQELKDKNGKPALEVCTSASIATALFDMAVKGLDASKKTCYFIARGDKMCLHESYFGKALQVRRIYPNFEPHPVIVHEGDEFEYAIDPETGYRKLVKHIQKIENLDKDFIGGYIYIPTPDGKQDLYIMSKKMIMAAWSKSSSREQLTHKTFPEKMAAKTLVSSACNMIINATPDLAYAANENDDMPNSDNIDDQTYQEVPEPAHIEEAPKPSSPAAQPEKGPDQAVQEAPRAGRPRKSAAPQPEPEPEPSPAQEQAVHAPEASEDDIPEF